MPAGTSASWTASPGNLFTVDNGTGPNFTTRANGWSASGTGTITATINGNCGNIPATKTSHRFTISIANLNPGIYIVRVSDGKKVYSGLLRVEK